MLIILSSHYHSTVRGVVGDSFLILQLHVAFVGNDCSTILLSLKDPGYGDI